MKVVPHKPYGLYERFFKRPLDFCLALCAVALLSPLMALLALLVKVKLGSPVLFSQERIGKDEKVFKIHKFRTMTDARDAQGRPLPDEQRLTSFGKKLRSTSLDELPELFSIIKGDMAIVGPRPMPIRYLPYFRDEERALHSVRGGLIPPDVLTLHTVLDWDEQFRHEVDYAGNITFLGDLKIILSTFVILFKRNRNEYGGVVRKPLDEARSAVSGGNAKSGGNTT